jgi:cystathionine gamma-lyase
VVEATAAQMCDAAVRADLVLAETPTNPALDVVDLHRLAGICHQRGARLLVDNTAATPLGQQPLSLGADLVVASGTKALAGHSDLVAGYVAGSHPELMAAIERERLLAGPILGALEAWLLLRSIGSFGLRFERQCQNALALATALSGHRAVRSVRYPGLPDDPSHAIAVNQMRHFGGLVSVELADAAAVRTLVAGSELLVAATSFGGIHTSVDRRARWGDAVGGGFARISAGIEDTDDLVADVEAALGSAGR